MSDGDICKSKKENNFYIEAPAIPTKKKETNGLRLRRLHVQKERVPRDVIFRKSLNSLRRWNLVSSLHIEQAKNLSFTPLTEGFGRNKVDRNLQIIGLRAEK